MKSRKKICIQGSSAMRYQRLIEVPCILSIRSSFHFENMHLIIPSRFSNRFYSHLGAIISVYYEAISPICIQILIVFLRLSYWRWVYVVYVHFSVFLYFCHRLQFLMKVTMWTLLAHRYTTLKKKIIDEIEKTDAKKSNWAVIHSLRLF